MAFANQCITFTVNGQVLALDYSAALAAGAPDPSTGIYYQGVQLKPLTGAPGQIWSFEQLTNSNALVPVKLGWFCLDGKNLWLGPPWDDAGSDGNLTMITESDGTVTFGLGTTVLEPTSDGTSVQMAAPAQWSIVTPPVYNPPPPQGSTTAATIIPNLPTTGLQGAWWDGNGKSIQQFDSDDWLAALGLPAVDASGNQNCVMMDNGIGTQATWSTFDGDAYASGQITLGAVSISHPTAPQYIAIPLQAIPTSDSTNPTLNQAGTGAFNSHYTNAAGQFGASLTAKSKFLWRLNWELIAANNTWYGGGYQSGFTPAQATQWAADFVASWNQMAASVLPILPGELVWNLNQDFLACPVWQQAFPTGKYQPSIVAVDVYYQGWMGAVGSDGGTGVFNQYHLPGLQAAAAFAKQNNCRFAICEWGIQNGDAPGWVTALGQFITSLAGETVTINGQTLPLYTYAGAYIVGPDCIDPGGTPNSMAVFEKPPFGA